MEDANEEAVTTSGTSVQPTTSATSETSPATADRSATTTTQPTTPPRRVKKKEWHAKRRNFWKERKESDPERPSKRNKHVHNATEYVTLVFLFANVAHQPTGYQ